MTMAGCRIELRLSPTDPLWPILGQMPGRQRNALARAVLEAALLPGGWARWGPDTPHPVGAVLREPTDGSASSPDDAAVPSRNGMSSVGTQSFLTALRQFGALTDDE
ncbi:hypothetical protein [Sulfobacillus thermosulfidooxidans]|uniref:hypothetical protein n=1 Tax=Sulfobacillus thermosulfidooxidans TaxID=28034 RepID=UPI0002FD1061|nr:hypothetical protein [Sulfobacillus thermosulfidooxidans]